MNLNNSPKTQSRLQIDLEALGDNYNYFKSICRSAEVAGVVKANGYGLGAQKCSERLFDLGCKSFFVAHIFEAISLRKSLNKYVQIYVLNGFFEDEISGYVEFNLIPVINTFDQLELWQRCARGQECAIHIDTGMNRLGLSLGEFETNTSRIKELNLGLVLSHLACASDGQHTLNQIQLSRFDDCAKLLPNTKSSLAASAGTILGPEYQFDLTRIGIGLYGSNPMDTGNYPIKPVVTLSSPILQTRTILKGECVGYGASYIAPCAMKIAIVALGYADGFLRSASNSGFGVLDGVVCPIIGRVSMDLIALDISHLDTTPKIGAQIEFLGESANIDKQAKAMGTIAYEVLTRLGSRFKIAYR